MTEEALKNITEDLSELTLHEVSQIRASLTGDGKIPKALILGLYSNDLQIRRTAVTIIRQIQAVQPVIDAGLVPTLVSLLDSEDATLQCEAAWILTNIAVGTNQRRANEVAAGVIPKLVALSKSPSEDVSDNAVWALATIIGDSQSLRERVDAEGGIDALVRLLNDTETTTRRVQRRAMRAFNSYINHWSKKNSLDVRKMKHLISLLVRYIREAPVNEATAEEDKESIAYAIQSLTRILDRGLTQSDVIETGVVPRLVHLLADLSSGAALQTEVFQCIGCLIVGDDRDKEATIEAGLLPTLLVHLEGKNNDLCRWALWSASYIAAGNRSQAHALLDCGLLKPTVHILTDDQSPVDCRREACRTISNLSNKLFGDVEMVQAFIDDRCVEGLSSALQIRRNKIREAAILAFTNLLQCSSSQVFQVGDSLLTILRRSSVPQNLRDIRDSRPPKDDRLRNLCQDLITRYFPEYSKRA